MKQKQQDNHTMNQLLSRHDNGLSQRRKPRTASLEWQFPAEDEEWTMPPTVPEQATGRGLRHHLPSTLVLVFVLCATFYLWWSAESGARLVEKEIASTIAAEAATSQLARPHQLGSSEPDDSTFLQAPRVQDITFHGNYVSGVVESRIEEPDGQSYRVRQRRFYFFQEGKWVTLSPNRVSPSQWRMLHTEFFAFSYHEVDHAVVEAIAGEVDSIYTDLRQDYGLLAVSGRITVTLLTDPPQEKAVCHRPAHFCVPSPAFSVRPIEFTEQEALRQWLVNNLVFQVAREGEQFGRYQYEWDGVNGIMRRVQMRRHSTFAAAWHRDFVHWLYGIPSRVPPPEEDTMAQELAQLCAVHHISVRRMFLARVTGVEQCLRPSNSDLWALAHYTPAKRLGDLAIPDHDANTSNRSWIDILEMEVLFDYILVTHGRDALAKLLNSIRHDNSWNTLIPAVFDISVEEFEAGWQHYVQTLP